MINLTDSEFHRLVDYVHKNFGINLINKRVLIEGRLTNTLRDRGFKNFSEYMDVVLKDKTGKEVNDLLNKLTTNHTFFMRENEHFDYLKTTVLPYFEKANAKTKDIRIWSAACSSGQEAYTIAMVIDEYFGNNKGAWDTTILATDISLEVLNKGKLATYPDTVLNEVPPEWRKKYFINNNNGTVTICDKIKKQVIFKPFNLMDPFPFKKNFDLIFCRNVMIYFDVPTKDALVEKFYNVTAQNGFFFIGHSESINKATTKYKYIKPAMYRKEAK